MDRDGILGVSEEQQNMMVYVSNKEPIPIMLSEDSESFFTKYFEEVTGSFTKIESVLSDNLLKEIKETLLNISKSIGTSSNNSEENLKSSDQTSSLITSIKDQFGNFLSSKKTKKNFKKVNQNPSVEDLTSSDSIEYVIPTGFLLLHNDLKEFFGDAQKSSSKKRSKKSSGSVVAASTGGLVAGVTSGLVSGIFDAFKDDPTDEHFASIASELNLNLTPEMFEGDADIVALQRQGFLDYLTAYYRQKSLALLGATTGDVVESAIEGVGRGLKSLFGIEREDEVSKLDQIVQGIVNNLDQSEFIENPEVLEINKKGVINYLKAYYITQTAAAASETVLGGLSTAAGTAVNGFLTSLFGKEKSPSKLETIINAISERLTPEDYIDIPEVYEANKEGIIEYLKAYYKVQSFSMQSDGYISSATSSLGESLGGFTKGLLKGLFGAKEEKSYLGIQNTVNTIIEDLSKSSSADELSKDEGVINAYKEGIIEYLKAYYKVQSFSASSDTVVTSVSSSIGESVKGFFTGLFGSKDKDKVNPFQRKVEEILSSETFEGNIDANTLKQLQNDSLNNFLNAYYSSISDNMIQNIPKNLGLSTSEYKDISRNIVDTFKNFVENNLPVANTFKISSNSSMMDGSELIMQQVSILKNIENAVNNIYTFNVNNKDKLQKPSVVILPSQSSNYSEFEV